MDSNHRSPKGPVFVAEGELRNRTGATKKSCFLYGTDGSNPSPSSGESANHRSLNIGRGSAPTRREGPISYDDRDRERATRQALALDTVACVNQLRWFGDLLARLRLRPTRRVAWLRSVHDELW